ncbi:MAG: amidohydrolase family protein [Candidatus Sulfotelmatobacter sp.]
MRAFACLLALFVICGSMLAQVTVVRAGRLVDPDSGTVLSNQIILISGNKIQAVGPDLTIPAGAKVIDLSGETVLPGLIDCHTHVADGQSDGDPFNVLRKTASQIVLESVPNARNMLLSGFTTVRDVGTYRALNDVALRDAINRGDVIGPRMFVAGAYITITGGAGAITGQAPDIQLPWDLHYGEANGPWEVRQKVRLLAHDGVDVIKMLSTGAVLTHGSSPKSIEFTEEELQAGVDEANHFGLRVAVHAHAAEGIRNAILAGAASIEHAEMLDDDLIALAKQHGTYLDMDIYDEECIQAGAQTGQTPPDFLAHDAELGRIQRESFRKAVKAGAKMTFGTDAGVCPYGTSGKQFAFMVKYGMTPMQAIQAATSNAADLLGHSTEIGSIKPGKFADLIAVTGDPLKDISVLGNVEFVMKDGKVYKSAGCSCVLAVRPAPDISRMPTSIKPCDF